MLKDEIEKELKKYHCWHTPLDCQGCDKSDVCDKETAQALTHILELVEKCMPEESMPPTGSLEDKEDNLMPTIVEVKEAIEVMKRYDKEQLDFNSPECVYAIKTFLSPVQSVVEAKMPEKKKCYVVHYDPRPKDKQKGYEADWFCRECERVSGFNEAIDLCNIYLAKKMAGFYDLAERIYYLAVEYERSGRQVTNGRTEIFAELSQALQKYMEE